MLDTYKRFWSLTFNNEERDNRYQFWVPFLLNIALLFLLTFSIRWIEKIEYNILFLPVIIILFLVLSMPMLSAVTRRINDVGKDNQYYKYAMGIWKIFIGIMCIIILAKYVFEIKFNLLESELFINTYFAIFIIAFVCYALLPTNYFNKNNIKNRIV
ncbi:DUF805 domain-containing protein [Macrococcoides bohemicum]|uniref:DUF805 domain-containing protein n=1 Tax=Macrococcoides bohemicum TaxID=1903056 RepID=UPI000BB58FB4|nr:DUF805 domain-containing protein [Macrococcus sp. IME1552]ATD31084.1 hypothetical protein BHM04_07735 [Macrococcus sp. IME1552]